MGKNKNAGRQAAEAEVRGAQLGVNELRRQFDITQENFAPFLQAGTEAIPRAVSAIDALAPGATAGGLDARLAEIFNTDIFDSLVDERTRAVQGQLAASGLSRSGTAIQEVANIPAQLGLAIEDLLTGRQGNQASRLAGLAGVGQSAAGSLGQFGAQSSQSIANLFERQGQSRSAGIITDAQAGASGLGQVLKLASGVFFSDPCLKENAERISEIGDLGLYEWDWKPFCEGTIIAESSNLGFMADEVEEKYPHHVGEFGGFMIINYPRLIDELEMKYLDRAA